ncbi:MAG: response regulator, partial [Gemmatimonadota bacterium]|nr:response regulator [Gemmatimonadota bacterium]
IQQILVFSRAESRPMMAVDIPLALEEAARFLRASLPASITIEVDTAPDSGTVLGDATQIQQVLINLGTNAGHAMKDGGGRLALRCAPGVFRGGDDGEESPAVVIQVEDTGVGMTQDTLERLFDPFFSTKPSGEGTGLGLSVVHGIVSGHGGHINVSSQLGDGTTVTVVLPQGITEVVADVVPDEEVNREDGSGRIMIVDDEEFIVELLSTHLTDLGYQSIVFNSPVQALEFAREDPVDLLLTDFAMPGMTGLDLAERLREAAPRLPVILMTGYGADLHPDRIHALGVHRVLHKPFRLPTLAAAVRQALGDAGGE